MDEFLTKMIAHVDQQFAMVEKECSILRKLLKPWPKKRTQVQENKLQDNLHKADADLSVNSTKLTTEEKVVVDQVDHLIVKAQKALRIKEKTAVSEGPSVPDLNSNDVDKAQNETGEKANIACHKNTTGHSSHPTVEEKNHAIKKQPQVKDKISAENKDVNFKTRKSTLPNQKNNKHLCSSSKETRSIEARKPSCDLPRRTTPRPSSILSNSRPSSSRSRYTPVHLTAPFKTEVNTRVPHRKQNHIRKNQMTKPMQIKPKTPGAFTQPSQMVGFKALPKIESAKTESNVLPCSSSVEDNDVSSTAPDTNNSNNGYLEEVTQEQDVNSECVVEHNVGADDPSNELVGSYQEKAESAWSSRLQPCDTTSPEGMADSLEAGFKLTDKSSTIKVPPKLSRLVSENCALFEKCSTAKLVKKIPDADPAVNFIEELEAQAAVSQEVQARAGALACLDSHRLMLLSLQALRLDGLSDKTPFETAYRNKRLLEFVLSVFANTQDEADYYSQVHFKPAWCKDKSPVPDGDQDTRIKSLFSIYGHRTQEQGKAQLVWDALKASKHWAHLMFEKHLHQLHHHLLSLSEEEWGQVLTRDTDSEQRRVLQMVHGLLTSNGQSFPVMVENPYLGK